MAKIDFCFVFYDGDATSDMFNMNLLERGAYLTFLLQQRQNGHLSLSQIKKILGDAFSSVWDSILL